MTTHICTENFVTMNNSANLKVQFVEFTEHRQSLLEIGWPTLLQNIQKRSKKMYFRRSLRDFIKCRRDSEWQWHQLGQMQVCTSLQTDNHASTPPLSFLQAGCPSCRPTNSVKALKVFSLKSVH